MNDRRIDLAALVLRLTLGTVLIAHGLLKLVVFTPAGTAAFFEKIGLPGPLGYLVIAAELVAGAAILVAILDTYNLEGIRASERDILDGAALAAAELPEPEEGAAPPGAYTCC